MNIAITHGRAILAAVLLAALPAASARAQTGSGEPIMLPEPEETTQKPRANGLAADSFVAEVIDSTFFIGPAEFFAIDLPSRAGTASATHLFGTVRATGGSRDIIVRLFAGDAYDRWLKKRGGDKAGPFWVSSKSKSITLDHPLRPGQKIVLLLDNGYSLRTPKRVHVQLQIHYRRGDGDVVPRASARQETGEPETPAYDDILPVPRSNEEEEIPPPPPPPPDDGRN